MTTKNKDTVVKNAFKTMNSWHTKLFSYGITASLILDDGCNTLETLDDYRDQSVNLSLTEDRSEFLIEAGLDTIGNLTLVAGSNKFKQVVLSLKEEAREQYKILSGVSFASLKNKSAKDVNFQLLKKLFDSNLPAGTKYSIEYWDVARRVLPSKTNKAVEARITAKSPASHQYFLVGQDEKHLFICGLPSKVSSVAEAHKVLIPKEVANQEYVRQGEFFFVPVPAKDLNEYFWQNLYRFAEVHWNLQNKSGDDSDHYASIYIETSSEAPKKIVIGSITHERHQTLILNAPHYVYVSNEIEGVGDNWD